MLSSPDAELVCAPSCPSIQGIGRDGVNEVYSYQENEPTGVLYNNKKIVNIYPNPSRNGRFYLDIPANMGKTNLIVRDLSGKTIIYKQNYRLYRN